MIYNKNEIVEHDYGSCSVKSNPFSNDKKAEEFLAKNIVLFGESGISATVNNNCVLLDCPISFKEKLELIIDKINSMYNQ